MSQNTSNKLVFFDKEKYRHPSTYQLLPFSFTHHSDDRYIISNDSGEYTFLTQDELGRVISRELSPGSDLYLNLKGKFFIADTIDDNLLNLLATKIRTKKSFLYAFTSLHIFVVTLRCDHSCGYCQVSRQNVANTKYDMSPETADKSVDLVFKSASDTIKIEFQGGESLLNFSLVKRIVLRALEKNKTANKNLQFIIATNLSNITDDQLEFCKLYNILISTSLDGTEDLHNANRPLPSQDSYKRFSTNLERVRSKLGYGGVSALMTTTTLSLQRPKEIIDEYVKLGFRSIFLRSISPYGFATRTKNLSFYETEEFLKFYKTGLDHILNLNRKGIELSESLAEIILRKILTPFPTHFVDLQSPAGVGIGAVVYNYDGLVYLSDEARMLAEMGDKHFALGDVHQNTYAEIFTNPILVNALNQSVAEVLPGCSDCAYKPFCGADPTYHYRVQGDEAGHRPTSGFCQRNMGVIRHLIDLIESGDQEILDIFYSWINRTSVRETKELRS
ncbi:MAG: His-Xaa-Ser system radical SAM maturase HxsB [Deltaproteobacteria bacterium]|nr:MAG: His-Xaa-Ser system radical SAM maturase HxsB [Deltaproteobacteria bacterium]